MGFLGFPSTDYCWAPAWVCHGFETLITVELLFGVSRLSKPRLFLGSCIGFHRASWRMPPASAFRYHLSLVTEHFVTGLGRLIPVPVWFRHRHSFSFRNQTDRRLVSPAVTKTVRSWKGVHPARLHCLRWTGLHRASPHYRRWKGIHPYHPHC